jgi:hypothetical protein
MKIWSENRLLHLQWTAKDTHESGRRGPVWIHFCMILSIGKSPFAKGYSSLETATVINKV